LTDGSLRRVFGLGENEFLFGPEGLEIPFVGSLYRWITGRRPPVIHDLTVGELFVAVKESSCDTEGDRLADAGS
ncbi:MAG: hypothetical protein KJO98_16135, partial [Rhodothermia bacterium]|nr:hypothetical protein [Rhodothermia bacterium]